MQGVKKAGDIITALFQERLGKEFLETARSSAGLFSSWDRIVTEAWSCQNDAELPAAAMHSRVRELEQGVLFVEADHPGWIQILQTKQVELLSAVQRQYPEMGIKNIVFKLSRMPEPAAGNL
ncbi:MAG: DUF721 domain-containing protein [Treponema sp.]|jgi:predicted nucleic acid-binding Zn ribbon protein|nr:DUF721 domain-containing protein [Treponema sp.]